MKNIKSNKLNYYTVYLLTIVVLMQLFSILLFPQYGDIAQHLLTRGVSFIIGLVLFWGITSKKINLDYDSDILLTIGIILMIIPGIQNGFSEFAQQISLFEGKDFSIQLNTSLWGVALSFPYLAKHFEAKTMKKFWIAVMLLNAILVLQISYSYLILFNISILTLGIKNRKALNKNTIGIFFLFSLILFVISYKANSYVFWCEFTDLFDNLTVINSTNHWFEGFMGIITGEYGFWGHGYQNGLLQGTGTYQDLWLSTYLFGFAGFVILLVLVFMFLEVLLDISNYKTRNGLSSLQLLTRNFFVILMVFGFVNGLDLLPINLNTGFPFISYSGVNSIAYWGLLGMLFFRSNQNIGVLSKRRMRLLVRKLTVDSFQSILYVSFFSLLLFTLATGIYTWTSRKNAKAVIEEVPRPVEKSFRLGIDSVLYDKEGKAYTTFYNPGNVFIDFLAVRDDESGKWGFWSHYGDQITEFKFDSVKGKFDTFNFNDHSAIPVMID